MKGTELRDSRQRWKYVVVDWITTNLAFFCFNLVRYAILYGRVDFRQHIEQFLLQPVVLWEQLTIPLFALALFWLSGYYSRPFHKSRLQELLTTFISCIFLTVLIYLALLTNDQITHRSSNWSLLLAMDAIFLVFVYTGRISITQTTLRKLRKMDWGFKTLVVGNSEAAWQTACSLADTRQALGYRVAGFVTIPGEENLAASKGAGAKNALPKRRLQRGKSKRGRGRKLQPLQELATLPVFELADIRKACRELGVNQIILAPASSDEKVILSLLYNLFSLDIPIRIAPDTMSFVTSAIHTQDIFGEPFMDLSSPAVSNSSMAIKRTVDVAVSLMALTALLPLFGFLALLIKGDSKGPVFYLQSRIGRHRRPFRIIKFRSMRPDAEKEGPQLSSDGDPRITRIGRILRKYRLDELPQFWNVLKGDMSLVGPRPEREHFINMIVKEAPYYTLVHQVRPGITSWGMVKFGYASTLDEMVRRTRYDLMYLTNMSMAVDMKILIYTLKTVFTGRGV